MLTLVALGVLMAFLPAVQVYAHGDAVEIFRGLSEPYEVVVRIQPENPVIGTVHITVTPIETATSLTVTDAEVIIVAEDEENQTAIQARALNTPDSPHYYDANITFDSAETWTLVVKVSTKRLGASQVTLPLEIGVPNVTPGAAGTWVFLALLFVLAGGAGYVWYSARRQRRMADG